MISLCSFELERRSLVHSGSVVLASCHNAKRPARLKIIKNYFHIHPGDLPHLEVDGVDGPGLPGDVSITGSSVSQEHVSKLLSTLPNNNNPRL